MDAWMPGWLLKLASVLRRTQTGAPVIIVTCCKSDSQSLPVSCFAATKDTYAARFWVVDVDTVTTNAKVQYVILLSAFLY